LKYLNFMNSLGPDREKFVDAWASMASLFSFSPSTARVCALLITAGDPLSPSQISELLGTSRGNVSMCLKELRGWGVVQRVPRPGDRREYYESRGDLFEQMVAIARERKRREFDPVVGSALEALDALAGAATSAEAERLRSVAEYLTAVDRIGREVLDHPPAVEALIALLKSSYGSRPGAGDGPEAEGGSP
jgi:DNA-binding transcriptional regulator GbsR (MarR family)